MHVEGMSQKASTPAECVVNIISDDVMMGSLPLSAAVSPAAVVVTVKLRNTAAPKRSENVRQKDTENYNTISQSREASNGERETDMIKSSRLEFYWARRSSKLLRVN